MKRVTKENTKQILATVVMGMNFANNIIPIALLTQSETQDFPVKLPQTEAEPLEYAVLPKTLKFVDNLMMAKAEAARYDVSAGDNSSVGIMNNGDEMYVFSGGTGAAETVNGGSLQEIIGGTGTVGTLNSGALQKVSGGTGTVGNMQSGWQQVYDGGSGVVDNLNSGTQFVSSGGIGIISTITEPIAYQAIYDGGKGTAITMLDGYQNISSGGSGIVSVMSNGEQAIYGGGLGTLITMSNGIQRLYGGGSGLVGIMHSGGVQEIHDNASGEIDVMYGGGYQSIWAGGTGTVNTMSGGSQRISSGGTGIIGIMYSGGTSLQRISVGATGMIGTMEGGEQRVSSGGSGLINKMNAGQQVVWSTGIGKVNLMNGGWQYISSGGTGIIGVITAGVQRVSVGGNGDINVMNGGQQDILIGGSGNIDTMNIGTQSIDSGGSGNISIMNNFDSRQYISIGASGNIDTMNSGMQVILGGRGNISAMNSGNQSIDSGGSGNITTMNSGYQDINISGSGNISIMNDGHQDIHGGSGNIGIMNSYGFQQIREGGNGNITTMNGGIQDVDDATGSINIMNGGQQDISNGGTGTVSAMYGGSQDILIGGTALNTNIYGGTQLISAGGSAVNTLVDGGTVVILAGDAVVQDVEVKSGEYLLGADGSNYIINGNFRFSGGNVDLTKTWSGILMTSYETLAINNLQAGGGTFILNTDLASESNGDKINIISATTGTTYVRVKDISLINGIEVTGNKNLLIITDRSEKGTFAGENLNAGGLWDVTPTIKNGLDITKNDGSNGSKDEWYLAKLSKEVNNDTAVLLEVADNSYALWRNTNDSLRKRLGDLRFRDKTVDGDGIWARYSGGKFTGSGFDSSYHMYQLGYDKADNAKSTYGFAIDSGNANARYGTGSGKDKLFAGSIYGTWYGEKGSYTDVVARLGQFDTDINSYGDYPDKANAKSHAYSLSVEYGKTIELNKAQGTFIEPQAQLIVGRLGSSSYTTDRGTQVNIDGMNSYIARFGFVAGQKTKDGNDVYVKASALHEFGGKGDVRMQAANGETLSMSKDYGDTWFEIGIGTNINLSKTSHFYGDIERSFGADIQKKWQINAGVRFEF